MGYLSEALEKAWPLVPVQLVRQAVAREPEPGDASFGQRWVLPAPQGVAGAAAEHAAAAAWTARLAAENRRLRGGSGKVLPAAGEIAKAPEAPPRAPVEKKSSVYLHGPVGTGKTMLMNLFYEQAQKARRPRLRTELQRAPPGELENLQAALL